MNFSEEEKTGRKNVQTHSISMSWWWTLQICFPKLREGLSTKMRVHAEKKHFRISKWVPEIMEIKQRTYPEFYQETRLGKKPVLMVARQWFLEKEIQLTDDPMLRLYWVWFFLQPIEGCAIKIFTAIHKTKQINLVQGRKKKQTKASFSKKLDKHVCL